MIGEGKKAACDYRIADRNNWAGIISVITDLTE